MEQCVGLQQTTPVHRGPLVFAYIDESEDGSFVLRRFIALTGHLLDGTPEVLIESLVGEDADMLPHAVTIPLDANERVSFTPDANGEPRIARTIQYESEIDELADESNVPTYEQTSLILFAMALLNVKNIGTAPVPISRGARKQVARKHGVELHDVPSEYRILTLSPFKPDLTHGGMKLDHANAKRLHLVRGHFATYGDHNKLFGKYTGTFWVPTHARGNAEIGEVVKSYDFDMEVA